MSGKLSVRTESFEGWRFSNYRFQAARRVNASVERAKNTFEVSRIAKISAVKIDQQQQQDGLDKASWTTGELLFLKWKVDVNSTLPSQGNLFIRVHKKPSFSLIQLIKKIYIFKTLIHIKWWKRRTVNPW